MGCGGDEEKLDIKLNTAQLELGMVLAELGNNIFQQSLGLFLVLSRFRVTSIG